MIVIGRKLPGSLVEADRPLHGLLPQPFDQRPRAWVADDGKPFDFGAPDGPPARVPDHFTTSPSITFPSRSASIFS